MAFEVVVFLVPFHVSVILKFAQHRVLKRLMLGFKFILSFTFTYLYKSCNFNYINFLLLTNNSVGISHCNHQSCSYTQLAPLFKIVVPLPSFLFHPLLMYFRQFPTLTQPIRPTNLLWFKQKGNFTSSTVTFCQK